MRAETKLETERIRLRCMEDRDQEALLELFSDPEVMKYYSGLKDKQETREWIAWNKRNEKGYRVSLWIAEDKQSGDFLANAESFLSKLKMKRRWKSAICLHAGTGETAIRKKRPKPAWTMASIIGSTAKLRL